MTAIYHWKVEDGSFCYPLLGKMVIKFIYFTSITKQVIQLMKITLDGPDVSARGVLVWEETGVPWENPRDQAGNP